MQKSPYVQRDSSHHRVRSFLGATGEGEHYISVQAPGNLDFAGQVAFVTRRYSEVLQELKLAPNTAVFRRIFLSDAANQAELIQHSALLDKDPENPVAVSIVQQPILPFCKIALLAYHIGGKQQPTNVRLAPNHVLVQRGRLGHLWSTTMCAGRTDRFNETTDQTRTIFADLNNVLQDKGATLADNCVRTWLYVKDVDLLYNDMVVARRELFEDHGLNRDTHYIASTGIEGGCHHQFDTVLMDAYSILGIQPQQIGYLNDYERLCEAKDYNVTFERGTKIGYSDRAHYLISGTASIDATGAVVHVGDVARQLDRTLENIDSLLASGGAKLADMTNLIVYLRDIADYEFVKTALTERFADTPMVIVQGRVCRPEWLIEIEGIAIAPQTEPGLPSF